MKVYWALLVLCGAALAAVGIGLFIHSNARPHQAIPAATEQSFQVKGVIRSIEADGKTVHVAHEDIPGYMPSMEMPLSVKDPALLRGLAPGDQVTFKLQVTADDSWIAAIDKLSADATVTLPKRNPIDNTSAESREVTRVQAGDKVPDFTLVNQDGKTFRLSEFRGKAVVLTFIYTRCPLPNFCPLMSKNFASLEERFRPQKDKVQLLSISFDPAFDTPEVLKRYSALYSEGAPNWAFATGTPAQVDYVTGLFGLIREPSNGLINHDLRTALISPEGKLVHVWRSNVWTPYEVQRMTLESLQPSLASSK